MSTPQHPADTEWVRLNLVFPPLWKMLLPMP